MKASNPLDAGGTTEYERERMRKLKPLLAAWTPPPGVREFAVPTTALLKAGMLIKKERATRLPFVALPSMKPGYGGMQTAQIAGIAAGLASVYMTPRPPAAPPAMPPTAAPPSIGGAPAQPLRLQVTEGMSREGPAAGPSVPSVTTPTDVQAFAAKQAGAYVAPSPTGAPTYGTVGFGAAKQAGAYVAPSPTGAPTYGTVGFGAAKQAGAYVAPSAAQTAAAAFAAKQAQAYKAPS